MNTALHLHDDSIVKSPNKTYRIIRTLGQGGFGITYLAETTMQMTSTIQGELGQVNQTHEGIVRVALKEFFMRDINGRDGTHVTCSQQQGYYQKYLEKFRTEAQNLSRLHHEGIISVLELFAANNTLYYAMEYIDGPSLQERIKQSGSIPESEAIEITSKISDALSFMHRQRMLHLDLKPSNIMLKYGNTPVLIDFGLSKQYDENGIPESSTTIGAGTQGFAPIEQADYHGGRDFPVTLDIYALGATLYKMLCGITPPVASSVMNDGLPLAPLQQQGVSAHTIQVIRKAMMPMKAKRFQSVVEMRNALLSPGSLAMDEKTIVNGDEKTIITEDEKIDIAHEETIHSPNASTSFIESEKARKTSKIVFGILTFLILGGLLTGYLLFSNSKKTHNDSSDDLEDEDSETTEYVEKEDARTKTASAYEETAVKSIRTRQSFNANGVSFTMIGVEGGTFLMGSNDSNADSDERPTHMVTLDDYYIGETEVTQELWEAVMGYNPSEFQYDSQLPVEFISWNDCQDFIRELNKITGEHFRIPTEAEWEYAARGGHKAGSSTTFAGSNSIASVGWFTDNSDGLTHPVKMKAPNPLGLYDMSGNLWEWCQDWYGPYSSYDANNPTGPSSGSGKALKGGAWNGRPQNCRLTNRDSRDTNYASNRLGLRLALSL